jgi:hypothetical protein
MQCESIGWMIFEDKDSVTLAPHVAKDNSQYAGVLKIPRRAILKIRGTK